MKRRSFLKSTLAAIAFTASSYGLAESRVVESKAEKIPVMCLEIGDQKIWLYDGDNVFDEGFASGTASVESSNGLKIKSLDVFNNTDDKVAIHVDGDLQIDGPITTHSNPMAFPDGHIEYRRTNKSIPHDGFHEFIETES